MNFTFLQSVPAILFYDAVLQSADDSLHSAADGLENFNLVIFLQMS